MDNEFNITSAKYVQLDDGTNSTIKATINDIVLFVPQDLANKHFQAIQEWVKEGNKIEDAD
tara:strand:- start:285 stop:467 length:183 start_codon:yes stop_codon:yes gene_type:complete